MCVYVCLFVYLSTCVYQKTSGSNFTKFSIPVTCGRDWVRLPLTAEQYVMYIVDDDIFT